MKDEDIIKMILRGDSEKYSILIDRYSSKIFSTAYNYTHNHEEARDLVQDILIKAYNSLGSYKEQAKFSTWLYRIAVNSCIDWSRRGKSRVINLSCAYEEDSIFDSLVVEEDGPEESVLRQEHKELIRSSLAALPEIYKTVLILFYFEELKVQEICTILDCPRRTIETRLYRGKSILKSTLKQELSGGEWYELQNL